jgi:protein-S-isoprenylcysteine O-methyltransferase Ste14
VKADLAFEQCRRGAPLNSDVGRVHLEGGNGETVEAAIVVRGARFDLEGTYAEARVLPPVYFLGAILLAVVAHSLLPLVPVVASPWRWAGAALIAIGLAFIVLPARQFETRGTTIKPFQDATVLVSDGLFALSRNPMYLGMVIAVVGVAVLLGSLSPFIVVAIFAIVLDRRFVLPEEKALEQSFGDAFREYRARVRRWF